MALAPDRVTATSPAVVLAANARDEHDPEVQSTRHVLQNVTGTDVIYLGGAGVDGTTGFRWDVAELGRVFEVELEPGEALYGFAPVDQEVHVLSGGR